MDLSPLSDLTAGNEVQGRRQRKQKAPKEKYFKETQIVAIVVSTGGQEEGTRDIFPGFSQEQQTDEILPCIKECSFKTLPISFSRKYFLNKNYNILFLSHPESGCGNKRIPYSQSQSVIALNHGKAHLLGF